MALESSPIYTTLTGKNVNNFSELLNSYTPIELADLLRSKPLGEQLLILQVLSSDTAGDVFSYLSFRSQRDLLSRLPSGRVANLLNSLAPDDRTALLEELPEELMNQLLKHLSPKERALTNKLLGYPENSVGRLMTPDYIAIKLEKTVEEVLEYIRNYGRDSETLNVIYAVDDDGILVDDIRIRELLLAPLNMRISEIGDKKFVALSVYDQEESAINVFRKYDRSALPVVDFKGILLGIVTVDDIMDVAVREDTEDIQRIGGVEALQEPYMDTPFFSLMQKRIGWLVVLFVGEMLTASAMGYFEEEIAQAVVLALFLPLIISSGGNAGSQASTLIIRAMALGEISLRDWWRIMRREVFAGLFLGIGLGCLGFMRVAIWSLFSTMYGPHWLLVAITIALSLVGVVLWGTLSGSMLPLFLKKCGQDPAVSSAPFVATLVDVAGVVLYFSIAMFVLKGTLL